MSEHVITVDLRQPLPACVLEAARSQLQRQAATAPRPSRRVLKTCPMCGEQMSSREFRGHPARCGGSAPEPE